PGRIGIFVGASLSGYLMNHLRPAGGLRDHLDEFGLMLGNSGDYVATRVSYKLGLRGPSLGVQTACSTSLVAVHLACQSLLNGECELAIAGGVSLNVPQKVGYIYHEGGILSPDGRCRAFDRDAQGTVGGEGIGVVVLKRLDEALVDQDSIRSVILGS